MLLLHKLSPRCDPSLLLHIMTHIVCARVLGRALCSVLGVGVTVPYRTVTVLERDL